MAYPNDQHRRDREITIHRDEVTRPFTVRVLAVDASVPSVTVEHQGTGEVFVSVTKFPVGASSRSGTSMDLPEPGSCGLAVYDSWQVGAHTVAILCWIPSDIPSNLDAVAHRAVDDPRMEGYSTRWRGVHRQPYPGQRSSTSSHGLHRFEDAGWDKMTRDLSEESLDPDRRELVRTTGRSVDYTEAGIRFRGPVNRPGADNSVVPSELLPDGTTRQVVFLQDGGRHGDAYLDGRPDMLPVVESLERVQEFGLDFPVPREVLESDFMDRLVGAGADPWARTQVVTQNGIQRDDQEFLADQDIDHPTDPHTALVGESLHPLGPTTKWGASPRRRGWIVERATGTLVGYHRPDTATYGRILKPVLFPLSQGGRFSTEPETGFRPVISSRDHAEARLAAVASMVRFPYDYNTTRLAVTKEGQVVFEVGATLPRENVGLDDSAYEHPYGAGRSIEGHIVGSTRLLLGKNRDEEDSLDLRTLGQVVLRLGADDGALPDAGRSVQVQNRAHGDAMSQRTMQYWKQSKLRPGDAVSLDAGQKEGAENVSLRAATDGGIFLRLGARNRSAVRRHLANGYVDGQGRTQCAPGAGNRAATAGRVTYGAGDVAYRFNDLRTAGRNVTGENLYMPLGHDDLDMDSHGLSADVHTCQDVLLRVGKNKMSDYSLLLDFEGGIIGIVGKDKKGRSLSTTLQGGVEMSIGASEGGQAMALEVFGDVNWVIRGNWHVHCTGDMVFDSQKSIYSLAKEHHVTKGTKVFTSALAQIAQEAPDMPRNQGTNASPGLGSNFRS